MIIYKKEIKTDEVFDKFICDRCKTEITTIEELQEIHKINFIGGYGSVFGDGNKITCDLCQDCLLELIGDFYRMNED